MCYFRIESSRIAATEFDKFKKLSLIKMHNTKICTNPYTHTYVHIYSHTDNMSEQCVLACSLLKITLVSAAVSVAAVSPLSKSFPLRFLYWVPCPCCCHMACFIYYNEILCISIDRIFYALCSAVRM